MTPAERTKIQTIADDIVETLERKDAYYGSSWKKHGGHSAFFNLERKWSRIEVMSAQNQYDLFAAARSSHEGIDALRDLVGYALLTLGEVLNTEGSVVDSLMYCRTCELRHPIGAHLTKEAEEGED